MKRITQIIIVIVCIVLFPGCDSFLDRQPDEALTTDMIFTKEASTRRYLTQIYGYYVDESNHGGKQDYFPWQCCTDEMSVAYKGSDRPFPNINRNTVTPGANAYIEPTYARPYQGIREATFFMQNVHKALAAVNGDESIITTWRAEARFLRAMYYSIIMKTYGPCILLGDDEIGDFTQDGKNRDRNTWDECVNYVVSELDKAAADLPLQTTNEWYGRATKGAAMAVKARLLLYSARPLFNGCELYKGVKNNKGENLFPQSYDPNKWKLAADAALDVISLNQYKLYGEGLVSESSTKKEVLKVLRGLFVERAHEEHIFTRETDGGNARSGIVPSAISGTSYGGVGPTQKLVDAFAMADGRYPITGYEANDVRRPIIDPQSGYREDQFVSNWKHPESDFPTESGQVFSMYEDREPRFYLNVFWSSLKWTNPTQAEQKFIQLYKGGNSSYNHNYSTTGYLNHKFHDPSKDTSKGNNNKERFGMLSIPIYRYAEVLLNYVEALNEYSPGNPDILIYLNKIRQRAGMPNLEDVYSDIVLDKETMRRFILRERNIELCYEGHRYFDTRTWMTSNVDDNGSVIGLNIAAGNHTPGGDFWKRTQVEEEGGVIGIRVFTSRNYLFPIPQRELDRVNITQNYGW